MKTFTFDKLRRKLILLLTALTIFACVGFFMHTNFNARADGSISVQTFLPSTNLEFKALNAPINMYSDDKVTAIAQNDQTLLIYQNGQFAQPISQFSAIKDVKKLDDNTLLISDNGTIYTLSLSDFSKSILYDTTNIVIGGNNFDVTDDYLITAFSMKASIYERNANGFTKIGDFNVNENSPIAINSNGQIFYANESMKLCTRSLSTPNVSVEIALVMPIKMIADQQNVYYTYENKVFSLKIADNSITELSVEQMQGFELGNLSSPSALAFKNGNLLIADTSLDAIQEFKIENGKLKFTGFAIASGKTAYNRISKTATDVEKYQDTLAVLDNYKLTVYSPQNSNKYARENYKNYFVENFDGVMPDSFALGKNSIVTSFGHGTYNGTIRKLNLYDGTLSTPQSIEGGQAVEDICYQSGAFYVLATNNTDYFIYKIDDDFDFNQSIGQEQLLFKINGNENFAPTHVNVDVFSNVYLADQVTGDIALCRKSQQFERAVLGKLTDVIKLETDLGGNLFVLTDSGIYKYDNSQFNLITLNGLQSLDKVNSFSMSFDKTSVYVLFDAKEYLCTCENLGNFALDQVSVSDSDYLLTDKNATFANLKCVKVGEGANVYSVSRVEEGFGFNGLVAPESEYAYICDATLSDDLVLSVLAGSKGVVLVNENDTLSSAPNTIEAPTKAFTTTNVCLYYFPILTKNGEYALSDNGHIKIDKGVLINPTAKITFQDNEFYFANVEINQTVISGYIPVSFTVEVLSENFAYDEYRIEKVNSTTLYRDQDMKVDIMRLSDNQTVHVLSKTGKVLKVMVMIDDNQFIEGYIKSSSIIDKPKTTVRNILIILAVTASVCGTLTYFLIRKKG